MSVRRIGHFVSFLAKYPFLNYLREVVQGIFLLDPNWLQI